MKKIDYSLSLKRIYTKAVPFTLLILAVGTLFYELVWHNLLSAIPSLWLRLYVFLPIILGLTVLHEITHIFGFWWLGKAGRQDWQIGIRSATPYAHCSAPMTLRAYKAAVVLPGLLLGILPLLLAFIFGWPIVFVYSIIMTTADLGDFFILLNLGGLPSHSLVADHASKPGCWLIIP